MKEKNIKFSVLVPVYQVEEYIDDCIQSVLNQTYHNWELILVDDGTKDKSGEICDRYAEQDDRIHVYHKENEGLLHTRRYAIARMSGEYCVFLDSDDWLKKNALEVIYHTIQKYECDCVVYGFERFLDGKVIDKSAEDDEICITDKRDLYKKCCFGRYGFLWRKAVKSSIFKGIDYSPYYHIQIYEDELQSLEILGNSQRVCFIENRLYNYRVNFNSLTSKPGKKLLLDANVVWQLMLKFFYEERVFLEKDYIEFCTKKCFLLCCHIVDYCVSKDSFSEKTETLRKIGAEGFCKTCFQEKNCDKKQWGIKTKVVFVLLKNGYYKILIFLSILYRKIISIIKEHITVGLSG